MTPHYENADDVREDENFKRKSSIISSTGKVIIRLLRHTGKAGLICHTAQLMYPQNILMLP